MYHSITFGDKNTWDDWHLIPSSLPVFSPPGVKTNYIDIPGKSGSIDVTESLTGHPLYNSREGSFEFYVIPDYATWVETFTMISRYLHGQAMDAVLEDDRGYRYHGRFSVNSYKSEKDWDKIVIDYHVDPYKLEWTDWLWDPFSFEHGIIRHGSGDGAGVFSDIPISTSEEIELSFTADETGDAPASVRFVASTGTSIGVLVYQGSLTPVSSVVVQQSGKTIPGLVLYQGGWLYNGRPATVGALAVTSGATLTLNFVEGEF